MHKRSSSLWSGPGLWGSLGLFRFTSIATIALFASITTAAPLNLTCPKAQELTALVRRALPASSLNPSSTGPTETSPGNCELSLTNLIRESWRPLVDRELNFDGLNCWASALFLKQLRPTSIYSSDSEFTYYVRHSGACRPLLRNEKPAPGDVGAIRSRSRDGGIEEIHAFIYLNQDYAISKQTFEAEDPLEITPVSKFFVYYGGSSAGSECETSKSKKCKRWTSYYRCEAVAQRSQSGLEEALKEQDALARLFEEHLVSGVSLEQAGLGATASDRVDALSDLVPAWHEVTSPFFVYQESLIYQFIALRYGQKNSEVP